jgi:hypothetical protein
MVVRPWQEALAEYVASVTQAEPGEPTDTDSHLGRPAVQNEPA